jgi:predicted esterase
VEEAKLRANDEDTAGIIVSQKYIHSLVQEEIAQGIPAERIVLGGFSQGGAMSIFSGLTAGVKLAGIIGLSSWLLFGHDFQSQIPAPEYNRETPILMAHGSADPVIRYEWANISSQALKAMGYNLTFKTYM